MDKKITELLLEAVEQLSTGKVCGDSWCVDDCGCLRLMIKNSAVEANNLTASGCCGCHPAVLDVKVVMETTCQQREAWKKGLAYSESKRLEHEIESDEMDLQEAISKIEETKKPKQIVINL